MLVWRGAGPRCGSDGYCRLSATAQDDCGVAILQELANAVGWGAKTTRRTSSIASIALYGRTRLACAC